MQAVYFNFFRKIPVFSAVSTVSAVFSKIFQKRHKIFVSVAHYHHTIIAPQDYSPKWF